MMSIWLITFIIVVLLLAMILLLVSSYYSKKADHHAEKRFYELLRSQTDDTGWISRALNQVQQGSAFVWLSRINDEETTILLKQAGWSAPKAQLFFEAFRLILPVAFIVLSSLYILFTDVDLSSDLAGKLFVIAVLTYLLPKKLLSRKAKQRADKITTEMPTVLHVLRMLFDAGLSIEQALRVLHKEGEIIIPEYTKELGIVLKKIDAGQQPAEALTAMAMTLDIKEVSDTASILKQVSQHGGNIRETLRNFAALMEERQLARTREYVNVLSGKMSLVMMIFLFPALLIFLAGPGFIALAKGLLTL